MAVHRFVAFDLGAESGRAILGTLEGDRLTIEPRHRFANPTGRMRGHLHWNLLAQWEQMKAGLRAATGGAAVDGIGVDTWGVDFALVGPDGEILGNPFHYRDRRTDGMPEAVFERIPRPRVFEITGIQFMQLNTLFQVAALQRQSPQLLRHARTLLFMPDVFHYLLTGRAVSEYSIASTSQMLDARARGWSREILAALDLPADLMPQIVPSATVLGPLLDDVAAEAGCPRAPVILPGSHDTASAVAAVPAEAASWCYISSGTWSLMGVELDQPLINERVQQYNYTNEGGVAGRIRLLKNISGLWPVQECRRAWEQAGREYGYAELTALAEAAPPLRSLLDLDHAPFLDPGDMPGKIERYCASTSQPAPGEPGQYVRACLESLALCYRRTLEGLEDVLGRRMEVIHVVGGGSQNDLLNQMTADACSRPVIAGPAEATAVGNVLAQAMAVGRLGSLQEMRRVVRSSFELRRFEPRDVAPWDGAYQRYRQLALP